MGKNILITAGGTTEPIDQVRKITNSGSGRLSSLIADAFAEREDVDGIFYVCSRKSLRPNTEIARSKTKIVEIETVQSLADAIALLLMSERIDVIVHAIAVSDYRTRNVTTADALVKELSGLPDGIRMNSDILLAALDEAGFDKSTKLSSYMENVLVQLEPTPKVIAMLRPMAPKAKIVGFKLLTSVEKDVLLDTAYKLLKKNDTDFVLANDSSLIRDDEHKGYLMDKAGKVLEFSTKQEIAAGIVRATLG